MPIDAILIDRSTGKDLLTITPDIGDKPVLVAQNVGEVFGTFKSVSGTVAGTFIVASVNVGQALVVTDILISSKKKAGSTLTLRFSDGTDTVNIFSPDTVSGEVNFGIGLVGRWLGWLGADIEVVTTADVVFTSTVGYFRVIGGDDFAAWDAAR